MKALLKIFVVLTCGLVLTSAAYATNGDNLIGIGPIARAMGGVGIAAPQDAISAVFANPAAMCFGPYCPASEINFAGTMFMPHTEAQIQVGGQTIAGKSEEKIYAIPAFGLSVPITSTFPFWRFGIAAYGVTGLGVDYRDTSLDQPGFYNFGPAGTFPLASGEYTQLQIMKFAPTIAFQPHEKFSMGLSLQVDYASLDLRNGTSSNYGFGVQVGGIYKPTDNLSVGLSYVSPQTIDHDNVSDFDGDGKLDTLDLESPQQVGLGVAYNFLGGRLLVEGDVKWINWAGSDGYEDFDWDDQWVLALGAQYKPMDKLALRIGYNYSPNPVNEHNGFVGSDFTTLQGHSIPAYYFESFRIIGFPAIVEHHITAGIGYDFTPKFGVSAGYMHAFSKTVNETGTNLIGQPTTFQSTLSEDSVDLSFTWRF